MATPNKNEVIILQAFLLYLVCITLIVPTTVRLFFLQLFAALQHLSFLES